MKKYLITAAVLDIALFSHQLMSILGSAGSIDIWNNFIVNNVDSLLLAMVLPLVSKAVIHLIALFLVWRWFKTRNKEEVAMFETVIAWMVIIYSTWVILQMLILALLGLLLILNAGNM